MDQALLALLVATLALLAGRYLFPSRSPGLIEDLRGIQTDLRELEGRVREEGLDQAPPDQAERLVAILLKANSDLQNQLLLCLDPLRLREGANLELQKTRLEAETAMIHAQVRAASAGPLDEAARRAQLAATLRARQAQQEEEEGSIEPDLPDDMDPLPGELDLPAQPKVLVGLAKPTRSPVRPRAQMGKPAASRGDHVAQVQAAAPEAVIVEQVEEQEQDLTLGPEDLLASASSSEAPASPLND